MNDATFDSYKFEIVNVISEKIQNNVLIFTFDIEDNIYIDCGIKYIYLINKRMI